MRLTMMPTSREEAPCESASRLAANLKEAKATCRSTEAKTMRKTMALWNGSEIRPSLAPAPEYLEGLCGLQSTCGMRLGPREDAFFLRACFIKRAGVVSSASRRQIKAPVRSGRFENEFDNVVRRSPMPSTSRRFNGDRATASLVVMRISSQ